MISGVGLSTTPVLPVAPPWRASARIVPTMRVVAGELGGRRLVAPDGTSTRPTTDRVREAVFNSLGSAGVLDGAIVADLFAGSGAIGIEALSRGAAHCVFVERDRAALRALDDNLDALDLRDRSRVVAADAATAAATIDADIVFADPPYEFDGWADLLGRVTSDLVVAESGAEIEPPPGWSVERTKRYGRTRVTFLERAAPVAVGSDSE
ncbi:MAG: 16S rRNA (guanine(966)-N(2))-methyltransferase RsmD [Ilumatobacteraceae bacterium]